MSIRARFARWLAPPQKPQASAPGGAALPIPVSIYSTAPRPFQPPLPAAPASLERNATLAVERQPPSSDERFAACLAEVLRHEGGFVDHPQDPGGATNLGISLRYSRAQGRLDPKFGFDRDGDGDVDRDDIIRIDPVFAAKVYRHWFWRDAHGDDLPPGLDLAVFDCAVNSGAGRALRFLQMTLRVPADGVFGPLSMAALRGCNSIPLAIGQFCATRRAFLRELPGYRHFGGGWERRVSEVLSRSLDMAEGR